MRKEKVVFLDEETKLLRHTIERVWDGIGSDVLSLSDEPNPLVSRYEVTEMCLDADRWRDYVKGDDIQMMEGILEKLRTLGFYNPKWKAYIRTVLTCKQYGY